MGIFRYWCIYRSIGHLGMAVGFLMFPDASAALLFGDKTPPVEVVDLQRFFAIQLLMWNPFFLKKSLENDVKSMEWLEGVWATVKTKLTSKVLVPLFTYQAWLCYDTSPQHWDNGVPVAWISTLVFGLYKAGVIQ